MTSLHAYQLASMFCPWHQLLLLLLLLKPGNTFFP
jgi:hypothetical protein